MSMYCNEFQSMIMPFIHNKLSIQKKEEVLLHLFSCSKCMEELEIYYIIINSIKGLDEEIDFPDNYHSEFIQFLKKTEKDIKLYKKKNFRHRAAFSAVVALSMILTGVSFVTEGEEIGEKQIKTRELVDSDLDMRFRFRKERVFYPETIDVEKLRGLLRPKGR